VSKLRNEGWLGVKKLGAMRKESGVRSGEKSACQDLEVEMQLSEHPLMNGPGGKVRKFGYGAEGGGKATE
jgi:hypothetical protein